MTVEQLRDRIEEVTWRMRDLAFAILMCSAGAAVIIFLAASAIHNLIPSLSVTPSYIAPGTTFSVTARGPNCPGSGRIYVLGIDKYLLGPGNLIGIGPQTVEMPWQTPPGKHTLYMYCPATNTAIVRATGAALAQTQIEVQDRGQPVPPGW